MRTSQLLGTALVLVAATTTWADEISPLGAAQQCARVIHEVGHGTLPASGCSASAPQAAANSGLACDSGSLSAGTCIVSGIKVDAGCARFQPQEVQLLLNGVRGVSGNSGYGCLKGINPSLADSFKKVFTSPTPISVCCGQCQGAGLPSEPISGSDCGLTKYDKRTGNPAVILNTNGPSNVFGNGFCGNREFENPIGAALLHEFMHVAGVPGSNGHNGGGGKDPASGMGQEDRDFIADPVYGCERTCYGRAQIASSLTCMACNIAVALPEKPDDQAADAQVKEPLLLHSLYAVEQKADAGSADVPQACASRWNAANDPGKKHYALMKAGLAKIEDTADAAEACVSGQTLDNNVHSLKAYATVCADNIRGLREGCAGFTHQLATMTTPVCNRRAWESEDGAEDGTTHLLDGTGVLGGPTLDRCQSVLNNYSRSILSAYRIFNSNARLASNLADFRCEDFFAQQGLSCLPRDHQILRLSDCTALQPGAR